MVLFSKKTLLTLGALTCVAMPIVAQAQPSITDVTSLGIAQNDVVEDPYRVAVKPFKSAKYRYDGQDLTPGKDIARILEGKLSKDRFEVMTRIDLDEVNEEQALTSGEGFTREGAPNLGELEGVECLIVGSVTEFSIEKGRTSSGSFMGFGGSTKHPDKANVSVEVSIVDTDSGRVVANASCRKTFEMGKKSTSTSILGYKDSDQSESNGSAAVHNLYYEIAEDLAQQINTVEFKARAPKLMLEGAVGVVDGNTVYIKMGRKQGVTTKMVFKVVRPYKGMDITIGEIRPINVDEEQSECEIIRLKKNSDGSKKNIKSGDVFKTKLK